MGRLPLLVVTLAIAFAGCLEAASVEPLSAAALVVDGEAAELVRWNGTLSAERLTAQMQARDYACWAKAPCDSPPAPCEEANCERRAFEVPEGVGAVVLSVRWPTVPDPKVDAWIEDASGAVVALAPREYVSYVGLVARIADPAPGSYAAVISARAGQADYQAALRAEPAAGSTARALLPDLVTLPPTDLILETPGYTGASYFAFSLPGAREVAQAAGSKGCRLDEMAEYRAVRCLRFSNAVANVGEGPLDIELPAGSLEFTQRVHASDGSVEERPGGAAEWHPTHAHWHNAASNLFTIRPLDPVTGAMGEPLGNGRKGGICFADTGIVDVGLPIMRPATFTGWQCFDPAATTEPAWAMGISPGWYDLYPYVLPEQYVDVTDVPDGTYALCSITNAEGTLLESDTTNNEACTGLRLAGDTVELLAPEPYHAIPAEHRL